MKPSAVITIVAAMLLFMGFVVYSTIRPVQVQCEICLTFNGEEVCRSGRGATEEEARVAAQESTCGGNVAGMAELIECRNRTPNRVQCTTP